MPANSTSPPQQPTLPSHQDDASQSLPQTSSDRNLEAEIRANPENFGRILDSGKGKAGSSSDGGVRLPTGPRRPQRLETPTLRRSNAIRISPSPPSTPRRRRRSDGQVLDCLGVDGKIRREYIQALPLDYEKPPPAKTPTVDSSRSEMDDLSPLLPHSRLAQQWEESRRIVGDETREQHLHAQISSRVGIMKWMEGVEDTCPTQTIGTLPPFDASRLLRNAFAQDRIADAPFDAARLNFFVFGAHKDERPTELPFDAARLTAKVFNVRRDEQSKAEAGSTGSAQQDAPRPVVLRDTTNIPAAQARFKPSAEQLQQDAFGSPDAQIRRPRGMTERFDTLPRLDTDLHFRTQQQAQSARDYCSRSDAPKTSPRQQQRERQRGPPAARRRGLQQPKPREPPENAPFRATSRKRSSSSPGGSWAKRILGKVGLKKSNFKLPRQPKKLSPPSFTRQHTSLNTEPQPLPRFPPARRPVGASPSKHPRPTSTTASHIGTLPPNPAPSSQPSQTRPDTYTQQLRPPTRRRAKTADAYVPYHPHFGSARAFTHASTKEAGEGEVMAIARADSALVVGLRPSRATPRG